MVKFFRRILGLCEHDFKTIKSFEEIETFWDMSGWWKEKRTHYHQECQKCHEIRLTSL